MRDTKQRTLAACLFGGLLTFGVWGALHSSRPAGRMLAYPAPGVVINEVAWMGTGASPSDEWIELHNPSSLAVTITGWTLSDGGDVSIPLSGVIPAQGYFLLERTDDTTISDLPADQLYSGVLNNSGETLTLRDESGQTVDTANSDGGGWPAGTAAPDYRSMERVDPTASDTGSNWATNDGLVRNGRDANGNPLNGTPGRPNSRYAAPGLTLAVDGPASATAGSTFTACLLVGNNGGPPAMGVVVTGSLPAGLSFVSQSSPFPFSQPTSQTLRWEVGDLPGGVLQAITFTLLADGSLSSGATSTATATAQGGLAYSASWTIHILPYVRLYALAPASHGGSKEAAALINLGPYSATLTGWCLDDAVSSTSRVCFPPEALIGPGQRLWLAQNADAFYPVWGFDADWAAQAVTRPVPALVGSWPGFTDGGEAACLVDDEGYLVDALAYGSGSLSQGWSGSAVAYPYAGYPAGQVLYRKLDQTTGRPVPDTDGAADWAQDADDPLNGRKLRYPGWDLEDLFFPVEIGASAAVTIAVAPEGALDLVSQTIASAQQSLRVEAYSLESIPLYEAISDRIQAGVVVTILLESRPAGGMEDVQKWIVQHLHTPPTSTVYFIGQAASRYQYQHAKFLLVDERLALVSSDNFGESSMPSDPIDNGTFGHRGFVLVTDSPLVVARLAEVFHRDCDPTHLDVAPYDDTYAPPSSFVPLPQPDWITYTALFTQPLATTASVLTLLHGPEHLLRDRDGLLGLLAQARSGDTVDGMQLSEPFTWTIGAGQAGLNPRLQAVLAAARRGARVRLLLDEHYDSGGTNAETCRVLNAVAAQEGLSLFCRLANTTGLGVHAKLFLVRLGPDTWVHLGSVNGTETASKVNREVALQFQSAAAYERLLAVFECDWARAHGPYLYRLQLPVAMRDYVPPAQYPLISEVLANPPGDDSTGEWIELYNPGPTVDVGGWTLGDAISAGDYGDGRYAFPTGARLLQGQVVVVAACGSQFSAANGFNPDYEWTNCDQTVPDLIPMGSWPGFGLALGNTQDEVVLSKGESSLVDSAAWGGGLRVGVIPYPLEDVFPSGASLKRYPPDSDRNDASRDFYVSYSPSPGRVSGR